MSKKNDRRKKNIAEDFFRGEVTGAKRKAFRKQQILAKNGLAKEFIFGDKPSKSPRKTLGED